MARHSHTVEVLGPVRRAGGRPTTGAAGARALPTLQARTVGEMLDTSFDALRARFLTCIGLTVPLWMAVTAFSRFTPRLELADQITFVGLDLVFSAGVTSVAVALVTVVVYGYMQGHRVGAGPALLIGVKRAPALLVTSAITGVAGLLYFCCVVPGLIVAWLFSVAPAALVLERLGPLQALRRSARLVSRGFLRWGGLLLTQAVLVAPFTGASIGLADPAGRDQLRAQLGMPPLLFDALDVLLVSVVYSMATALGAVVWTVFYLDNRVRNEGFDLHMRFERLRERHPTPGAKAAA